MQAVGKDERQLDREGLEQIWQYYRKDALLCTCKEVLRRQLFSEGIDFCVGHCSKKRKRSSTLVQQELIDDYWMPFALDALDCLLVMGVVPVALLEVNGSLLPVVPPFGTYTLSRVFDSETMTMGFEAKPATALPGSSEIELFVLGNYGYDPTYDCSLSSLVSCICSEVSYLKTARLQAMVRGELCNHPVLFAQSDPQKVDSETGLSVDFWANTEDGTLRSNPESTFRRNREEQSIYATQRRVYDAARRGRAIGVSPANAKPNLITLPPGQKIHQARLSNGNIDVTAATKIYEQTACAVLGIPRSMLVNDSAVKADVEGTHSMFRRTVLHWSRLLGRVLSEVHSRIPNDAASNKVTSKMSREELYTLKEKEGVSVSFPIGLFGTEAGQIFDLYSKGMLSYENYAKYSLKLAGIPEEALETTSDPLSEEEKKSLYIPMVQQERVVEQQGKQAIKLAKVQGKQQTDNRHVENDKKS